MLRNTRAVEGMISFDQQLLELFSKGRISAETALKFATSATDLKLRLQGFAG
jgi:Tfp pilus assembly ATPase PilU